MKTRLSVATLPHEPQTPDWKQVHTLVPPLKLGDKFYVVKLTVKKDSKGGYKLYDHKAVEMAKPNGIYEPHSRYAIDNDSEKLGYRPAIGLNVSLSLMLGAFHGDAVKYLASKVVDENGEPLVLYHGTPVQINLKKLTD
ncbi:MAG: hypothetical protein ACOYM1_11520 [Methylovulum sp.]